MFRSDDQVQAFEHRSNSKQQTYVVRSIFSEYYLSSFFKTITLSLLLLFYNRPGSLFGTNNEPDVFF